MTMRRLLALTVLVTLPLTSLACSQQKPEPDIASASGFAGYAETYPTELAAETTGLTETEAEVKKTSETFRSLPNDLKNPGSPIALEVVQRADEAGKSWAYVERIRQVKETQSFLSQEKDEITRRIAGAVQHAAKQKNCDADVAGAVPHAFKDAIDKRIEAHLRAANEAFLVIERHRDELSKEDAATLEKHADAIAYASYLAHVELIEHKLKLRRMVTEGERIKKTSDEFIEAESQRAARPNATAADKKAAAERIERMKKSRASVDAAIEQAKSALEKVDERIKGTQDAYAQAIAGVTASLKEKGQAVAAK